MNLKRLMKVEDAVNTCPECGYELRDGHCYACGYDDNDYEDEGYWDGDRWVSETQPSSREYGFNDFYTEDDGYWDGGRWRRD